MWVKRKLVLIHLEIVLITTQDRCTVCAERTIGMEIILGTPDGTPKDRVKSKLISVCLEIVLISVQDRCMVCAECTTGMETVLCIPDGTLGVVGQVEAHFSLFGDSVNLGAR